MFIWAVETGLSIAQDIIEQDSVEKISNFGKKFFQLFWTSGVAPGWARVGHLGGLMVEIGKSPRWRHINSLKVSRDARRVKIS